MGTIKRKKFLRLLKRIEGYGDIHIKQGTKHLKVESVYTGSVYPIPVGHREINKYIVRDFKRWLVENNIRGAGEIEEAL